MAGTLIQLLRRIRDGIASQDEMAVARDLVRVDERLPEELREGMLLDDAEGDAAGLLAVLGEDALLGDVLRQAMHADGVDVTDAVVSAVSEEIVLDEPWMYSAPLREAVAVEAGELDCWQAVSAELGFEEAALGLAAAVAVEAGVVELSQGVLAALGLELHGSLAAAVLAEAGSLDVTGSVLGALELGEELPAGLLAAAVKAEAGDVDLWAGLEAALSPSFTSALLDGELAAGPARDAALAHLRAAGRAATLEMTAFAELGAGLRRAVAADAGEMVSVWSGVADALGVSAEQVEGWDTAALGQAVRAEAGKVDVVASVMTSIKVARAVTVQIPRSDVPLPVIPEAANTPWFTGASFGAVALAALALIALAVSPYRADLPRVEAPLQQVASVQFASAGEIVVESLSYGGDHAVHEAIGDEGALIIWVDDEGA